MYQNCSTLSIKNLDNWEEKNPHPQVSSFNAQPKRDKNEVGLLTVPGKRPGLLPAPIVVLTDKKL